MRDDDVLGVRMSGQLHIYLKVKSRGFADIKDSMVHILVYKVYEGQEEPMSVRDVVDSSRFTWHLSQWIG